MPKNGRVAAVPPGSLRSALSDGTDGSTLSAWLLMSQAASRSACVGRRARRGGGGAVTSTCRGRLVERAGRHDDEVALAREHAGHRRQHQPVERVRAAEIEAPDDAGLAARGAFRVLLRQGVEPLAQRRHLLEQGLCAGIDLGPLGALARQRPHEALGRADEDGNERLVGPEQRLRLGQPQRLGIGERDVGWEGPDDLGARLSHLASRSGRCRRAARCGAR